MDDERVRKLAIERIPYTIGLPVSGVALYSWKLDLETGKGTLHGKASRRKPRRTSFRQN